MMEKEKEKKKRRREEREKKRRIENEKKKKDPIQIFIGQFSNWSILRQVLFSSSSSSIYPS